MTKLSALAISILLLLGATMWYTANLSFAQFMKEQVAFHGNQLTSQEVSYENFINDSNNYAGTFTNVKIANEYGQLVNIAQITYQVDKESIKEPIIILETLSLTDIQINTENREFFSLLKTLSNKKDINNQLSLPKIAVNKIIVIKSENKQAKEITLVGNDTNTDIINTIRLLLKQILQQET